MSYNEEFEPFKKVQEINSGGQGTILKAFLVKMIQKNI